MTRDPTNRNYLAIDSDTEIGITCQERFVTHSYLTTGVITRPLAVGICYEWSVSPKASLHYAWIAAGAHSQASKDLGDQWFVQGKLNFSRAGRPVGEFFFGDVGASISTNISRMATRELLRTRGDAAGSYQPVLRYQVLDAVAQGNPNYARDNLDIPCFSLPVRCDKITYEIQSFFVNAAAGSIGIITGARIVSLP